MASWLCLHRESNLDVDDECSSNTQKFYSPMPVTKTILKKKMLLLDTLVDLSAKDNIMTIYLASSYNGHDETVVKLLSVQPTFM